MEAESEIVSVRRGHFGRIDGDLAGPVVVGFDRFLYERNTELLNEGFGDDGSHEEDLFRRDHPTGPDKSACSPAVNSHLLTICEHLDLFTDVNATWTKIDAIYRAPPYNGAQREFARCLKIQVSQLNRFLNVKPDKVRLPSPRMVARLAATLPKMESDELIACYLREAAEQLAKEVSAEQDEVANLQ